MPTLLRGKESKLAFAVAGRRQAMTDYLRDLLAKLPPCIREAMEARAPNDDDWLEGTALTYLESSEEDQAWMREFVQEGEHEVMRQFALNQTDGVPTAKDVRAMVEGE